MSDLAVTAAEERAWLREEAERRRRQLLGDWQGHDAAAMLRALYELRNVDEYGADRGDGTYGVSERKLRLWADACRHSFYHWHQVRGGYWSGWESHGTDYNADKPGQRRTTIAVRVKFDPFTALTVPATSLRKAIDRHTAKTKTVRNTVENLRKKVQTLANGEGTDILTNVLSETMVSDEPAMKAMMQRLETAVDQAMRS
jgi:hypothetical protein